MDHDEMNAPFEPLTLEQLEQMLANNPSAQARLEEMSKKLGRPIGDLKRKLVDFANVTGQ
jgi:K+/H+ antiporter YhaU regulatory subunit KhtT